MRTVNLWKVIAILAIIIFAGVFTIRPLLEKINLGLDLRGGVHVLLQAEESGGETITDKDMEQVKAVMRERVDELGLSEPVIQRSGENRLIVELAAVDDPEEAVDIIGKTARLEFKTVDGTTVLSGQDLEDAQAVLDPNTNTPQVNLNFNDEGTSKFSQITSQLVKQYPEVEGKRDPRRTIAIYLDGNMLSSPYVQDPIINGQAVISGGFADFEEAANLAALLRGGALPVGLEIVEKRTVGPTLGQESLEKSKVAILVGFILVAAFMILVYRLPGVLADFSLIVYALIVLAIMVGFNAVLTLPGIAGLLLSVGMAVDANIIIFERFREELRKGKSLRAAVDAGFGRAFWTVIDASVTTFIVALILFYLGTGPVRGFALTLMIGIATSLVTAIFLTRFLLRQAVRVELFGNRKMYN